MAKSVFASVVFLKIQEFARRPVSEQARLRAQLEAVVAVTTVDIQAAGRIVLDASDGAAIVVLGDPQGALRLAKRALAAVAAGLPLSAGLNHGAIQLARGRSGEGMAGDGIAVAASVAEFAAPPRLLASRAFRDALADVAPGLEASLVSAGTFTDPGLRTHELFSPDARAAGRRARRYAVAGVLVVIALLSGGVAARISIQGQQPFVDAMTQKYRGAATLGQSYFRGLVQRVKARVDY
jgi:class 3 adenylate cyclase